MSPVPDEYDLVILTYHLAWPVPPSIRPKLVVDCVPRVVLHQRGGPPLHGLLHEVEVVLDGLGIHDGGVSWRLVVLPPSWKDTLEI